MKADIHPDYHEITVKMTNGETFTTRSTYGKKGDTLVLDIDTASHPAWTGSGSFINQKAGKVAKFANKFGSIGSRKEAGKQEESSSEDKPSS